MILRASCRARAVGRARARAGLYFFFQIIVLSIRPSIREREFERED